MFVNGREEFPKSPFICHRIPSIELFTATHEVFPHKSSSQRQSGYAATKYSDSNIVCAVTILILKKVQRIWVAPRGPVFYYESFRLRDERKRCIYMYAFFM